MTAHSPSWLDELSRVVDASKDELGIASAVILAPSNIAAITARRALASQGGVVGIEVTTIGRFAEHLALPRLGDRRPATRAVVAAAWRAALARDAGAFSEVADHPATVTALVRSHDTLRDLDEAALDVIAAQPAPARDLVRLHRAVRDELAADWYDTRDLLDLATQRAAGVDQPVVMHLPGRLSNAESRLLSALQAATDVTVIKTAEHHGRDTAARVLHASDSDDEVRLVVRHVVDDLAEGRSVAVLYADRSPYARLLLEQLADTGITVNGPGARPVLERATARAFLGLLDLVDRDAEHPEFDLPRTRLFEVLGGFGVRDSEGGYIPVAAWERASRQAGVVRGSDWSTRLSAWTEHDERPEWQREDGRRLLQFVTQLEERLRTPHETWRELLDDAAGIFTTHIADETRQRRLPPEEQHACTTVLAALRALGVLDGTGTPPSMRTLHDLLEIELDQSLPRTGRFGDGVYVGPVTSAAGLAHDRAYVVGLSEDLYPGTPHDDVLLPDRVRRQLDGALPTLPDRIEDQRQALLAALNSAGEVVASFPRGDLRQTKSRIPSRWLLPTLRELSGHNDLSATRWQEAAEADGVTGSGSFADAIRKRPALATEQEWRTRAAAAHALDDDAVTAARQMLEARASEAFTRFDGNLAEAEGLTDYRASDEAISPSALETYAGCPHAFFLQHMLKVRPVENPEDIVSIPANELGTFIHQCLEDLVKSTDRPGHGEPWTEEHHNRLRSIAEQKAEEYVERGVTGHARLWRIEREKILETLRDMLEDDSTWRSQHGARVEAAELEFGTQRTEEPPISVEVPSGGRVRIKGSADKIDVAHDRILVTDLKTGSSRHFTSIKQDNSVPHGAKLQLPAYALAARQQLVLDLPVTALYWFKHKESKRIELEVDDAVLERYAAVLDVLTGHIAAGVFPHRPPEKDDYLFTTCPYCSPDDLGYGERRRRWSDLQVMSELEALVALIDRNEISHD